MFLKQEESLKETFKKIRTLSTNNRWERDVMFEIMTPPNSPTKQAFFINLLRPSMIKQKK